MDSNNEYTHQGYFNHNIRITNELKEQTDLMLKDLATFGGYAYEYPSFKHVPYLEFFNMKNQENGTIFLKNKENGTMGE